MRTFQRGRPKRFSVPGDSAAGYRLSAHAPPDCDSLDSWTALSLGGCVHRVAHPGERSYDDVPHTG